MSRSNRVARHIDARHIGAPSESLGRGAEFTVTFPALSLTPSEAGQRQPRRR